MMTRFTQVCLCSVLLASTPVVICGQARAEGGGDRSGSIRVGYLRNLFSDVDVRDAQVAIEVWMKQVADEMGLSVDTKTVFFDDIPSITRALEAGDIDALTLPPLDFLRLRDKVPLEPLTVGVAQGKVTDSYIVLVRRDRGIATLEQLHGLKLAAQSGRAARPPALMWLETLLMRRGPWRLEDFFGAVKESRRSSQAILGVFFQQFDACLVTRRAYDTMVELNPQLGRELTVLHGSPGLMREMVCARAGYDEERKRILMEGAFRLQHYSKGRQILELFGLDRIVPFESSYLEPIVELLEEHDSLERKSGAKPTRGTTTPE